MQSWEAFYGPNVGYALELYERYLQNPDSVDQNTRAFFDQMGGLGDLPAAAATLARPTTRTAVAIRPNGKGPRAGTAAPPDAEAANGHKSATIQRNGASTAVPAAVPVTPERTEVARIVAAARLARSIREYGHLDASIDPLGAPRPGDPMIDPHTHGIDDAVLATLPASIVWPSAGPDAGTCLDAIRRLREIYCGTTGYEFDQVQDYTERTWLHNVVENGSFRPTLTRERRAALLERLTEVDTFEQFLHRTFQGQKRFSIEGTDALVPMLDQVIDEAGKAGVRDVSIGMAHRGRLNVLAHILRKPYTTIFSEFQSAAKTDVAHLPAEMRNGGGDVKYHRGAARTLESGLTITLAHNPSHLEFVNPVVQGYARAAQDNREHRGRPTQDVDRALCLMIHGDAAFPGEGVVAETLNLSRLPGYRTGGTIHIIVNNQVGFTTDAGAGRSTLYASDLAKGFEIPIVHVNADDPEACLAAARLAFAYRDRFHKDFLIDLVGYRRWGHNEGDEPAFTQPRLYAEIGRHPRVRQLYAERLTHEGIVDQSEAEAMVRAVQERLRAAREEDGQPLVGAPREAPSPHLSTASQEGASGFPPGSGRPTGHPAPASVPAETLRALNEAMLARPEDFVPNSKLERILERRRDSFDRPAGIDWGTAEALAFASILADGVPIRFSGQDAERGTFSQRHSVLHDPESGQEYFPLQTLPQARASFAVYNSPLTETAVLGFEYGYSVHAPDAFVLWEAQYGDFANVAQVMIDQFIAAARAKWQQEPALTLLLPHGYEGQGPEHSSARLERFLQLAAGGNLRVVYPTTAAQYFHVLRQQAASLRTDRRPLVVMTPKSLLRRPESASSLEDLSEGAFRPVIPDADAENRRDAIRRLLLCTGKVAIDLLTSARSEPVEWAAVGRVEQLYPFPHEELEELIGGYPNLKEIVWVQEEPANMGAWAFASPRLRELTPEGVALGYDGRPERPSTAEGSPVAHEAEQMRILSAAYDGERAPRLETQGDDDVD
jgi:2-oxoglutarate dehydrogenase E1 component